MNETAFNDWWNASYDAVDNPFKLETPAWWTWAAWQAATKVEREACAKAAGPEDSYRDEWFNAKADSVKRILARSNT